MSTPRHIFLAIIMLVICLSIDEVDAKYNDRIGNRNRGQNRAQTRNEGVQGSNINLSESKFYDGLVIIPSGDGTYYQGYGELCPNGCAANGICGRPQDCVIENVWTKVFAICLFVAIVSIVFMIPVEPKDDGYTREHFDTD